VYLLKGDDPSLLSQSLSRLVAELVGDGPADLVVENVPVDEPAGAVIDVCATPALLSDRRVVVVREVGRFRADEVEPIVSYLQVPMPSTSLVLVAGGGAIPTRLVRAVKEHGHVIDCTAPSGKARAGWIAERLRAAPVELDRAAGAMVAARLGEDLAQLDGVLDALATAYGEGRRLGVDEVEPFIGDRATAAPWDLTDAIDGGDTAAALVHLRRMLDGGQRHPLVVMATLQRHVGALLRLDGNPVADETEAAALLGMSPFPAKKLLAQSRRLGPSAIARAVELVAEADVDLRGASAWPPELVLEVLVARLSRLGGRRPSGRGSRGRG